MKNKFLLSFLFITVFQLIPSCGLVDCDCNFGIYEVRYTGMDLKAFDNSGFASVQIAENDSVYKNAFGLSINTINEETKVAQNKTSKGNFGINYAMACDCVPNEYNYLDNIADLTIEMENLEDNVITDVTDSFEVFIYQGNNIALKDYFKNNPDANYGLRVELKRYDAIAKSAKFTVRMKLDSGVEFVENTVAMNFYD